MQPGNDAITQRIAKPARGSGVGVRAVCGVAVACGALLPGCRSDPDPEPAVADSAAVSRDELSSWAVRDSFALTVHARGLRLPTALAFIADPASGADAPLYFVTELTGAIRTVTRSGALREFAHLQLRVPANHESGLGGICLDPTQGYVFVTYAAVDSAGVQRNHVERFTTTPRTFESAPTERLDLSAPFAGYEVRSNHQVGACQVADGLLYVSVGDGLSMPAAARDGSSMMGKIVRMALNGRPLSSNPGFTDNGVDDPADYVWALGFRNPFGMRLVSGRVFVADNGGGIDRWLEVAAGGDYLWSGDDAAIATNAKHVFSPGAGLAHVDRLAEDASYVPASLRGQFLVTRVGNPLVADRRAAVVLMDYDFERTELRALPAPLLEYRGPGVQMLSAVAAGPDGIYFAPFMADNARGSAVLRLALDPTRPHATRLERVAATELFFQKGCAGCHRLVPGFLAGGDRGPALQRDSLREQLRRRLAAPDYLARLDSLDRRTDEPFISSRPARDEVRNASDRERPEVWLRHRILEPRFDDPAAQMPRLGVTNDEATRLATLLLKPAAARNAERWWDPFFPNAPGRRHLVLFAALGMAAGAVLGGIGTAFLRRRRPNRLA